MMRRRLSLLLASAATALALAACASVADAPDGSPFDALVITTGTDAPAPLAASVGRLGTVELQTGSPSVGGSASTPVTLNGSTCSTADDVSLSVVFVVTGNTSSPSSFVVDRRWTFDGTSFVASDPVTVNVPVLTGSANPSLRTFAVPITLANPDRLDGTASTVAITPRGLVTNLSDPPGQRLSIGANATAIVHVAFTDCEVPNTPPSLTLPPTLVAEATSSAGAPVAFTVLATDNEDGDLTPTCEVAGTPVASGDAFPIGPTTVDCSVADSGGLSATGSFDVHVQDTTAPVFATFPSDTTLVATSIAGRTLDLAGFAIEAHDFGPDGEDAGEVSPPVAVTCSIEVDGALVPADGFQVALGQTVTVLCVASDGATYRAPVAEGDEPPPAPNVSAARSFDVFVGLDLSTTCGFKPPLRPDGAPVYSAHKLNSTVPHKLCPPAYADGTLATDLASGLRLELRAEGDVPPTAEEAPFENAAGSTAWRYDSDDAHYIFNLKTLRGWAPGQYRTVVSFAGIELAATSLVFVR